MARGPASGAAKREKQKGKQNGFLGFAARANCRVQALERRAVHDGEIESFGEQFLGVSGHDFVFAGEPVLEQMAVGFIFDLNQYALQIHSSIYHEPAAGQLGKIPREDVGKIEHGMDKLKHSPRSNIDKPL